jgi:hypothetical protein
MRDDADSQQPSSQRAVRGGVCRRGTMAAIGEPGRSIREVRLHALAASTPATAAPKHRTIAYESPPQREPTSTHLARRKADFGRSNQRQPPASLLRDYGKIWRTSLGRHRICSQIRAYGRGLICSLHRRNMKIFSDDIYSDRFIRRLRGTFSRTKGRRISGHWRY